MRSFTILLLVVAVVLCWSVVGSAQNYTGVDNCASCHDGSIAGPEVPEWMTTAHATAYDSISTFVQQTASCLECHTTGWDTTVANMGADDFATIDTSKSSFNVTIDDSANYLARVNVQCESCHGPTELGVNHPPEPDLTAENCGTCHQGTHHPYIEEWQESAHFTSRTSPFVPSSLLTGTDCAGCHTLTGFVQFVGTTPADSANMIPVDIDAPGEADAVPVNCATCHDPHNNIHEGQLRMPKADLCVKCHNPEEPEPGEDVHHATSEMWEGVGAIEFAGFTYDTESVHQLLDPAATDKCVTCHVFSTPFDEGDPDDPSDDQPAATGHTFEPRVEGCMQAGCHESGLEVTSGRTFDHRGRQTLTDSLVTELQTRLENASPEDSTSQVFAEALFNLQFVTSSGSHGVHNPDYAEDILVNTIAFIDQNGFPTSIEETGDSTIPDEFALSQNYPNPFNPVTKIRFDVPQSGHVKVLIYNSLGQVVETLVDEELTANSYEVSFDGADLPSGLYFYRLVANNFTETKKMLLLK